MVYEREQRAFAEELLMPFGEVCRRWFALLPSGSELADGVRRLAREFGVTPSAMKIRLGQLPILRQ